MFTPEAISGKTFRRLTIEKDTLAREIDKGKTAGTLHGMKKENVSVLVSWGLGGGGLGGGGGGWTRRAGPGGTVYVWNSREIRKSIKLRTFSTNIKTVWFLNAKNN